VASREKFIEGLKLSPELKDWLKAHMSSTWTMPGLDRVVTPDDIIRVPEFLCLPALQQRRRDLGFLTEIYGRRQDRNPDGTTSNCGILRALKNSFNNPSTSAASSWSWRRESAASNGANLATTGNACSGWHRNSRKRSTWRRKRTPILMDAPPFRACLGE